MSDLQVRESIWTRFWHVPVRAEALALTRILFGVALLTDQLFQYLPNLMDFFGPGGVAPAGLFDTRQLRNWRWTVLIFHTDNPAAVWTLFGIWMAVTVGFIVGWQTRLMSIAVWFLSMCFVYRNPLLIIGADHTLMCGLFLLMLTPCGRAWSLDARRQRRRGTLTGPAYVPAWTVRLLQIQLCVIYLTTGLVKLKGDGWDGDSWIPKGQWWEGTTIHYVLNYVWMSRWSYAQLPLPLWMTAILTWTSVAWEVLFTPMAFNRWTRRVALAFGVMFHLGIWFTVEVGWFSFYTLAFYGAWIPGEFWDRFTKKKS